MIPKLTAVTYKDSNKYVEEAKAKYGPQWKQVLWEQRGGTGPARMYPGRLNKNMGLGAKPVTKEPTVKLPNLGFASKIANADRDVLRAVMEMRKQKLASKHGLVSRALQHTWKATVGGGKLKPGQVPASYEAKKLITQPKKTLKRGWKSMGMGERSMFGLFGGMEAADAMKKRPDRAKRVGSALGGAAGWLAFRKSPLVGMIAGTAATAYAGGKAADLAKRALTKRQREHRQ